MRPFAFGERVTWKIQDHGKTKKLVGLFQSQEAGRASVMVDGKIVTTQTMKLNRCRGRKPVPIAAS